MTDLLLLIEAIGRCGLALGVATSREARERQSRGEDREQQWG
jgi:hypothetical protein